MLIRIESEKQESVMQILHKVHVQNFSMCLCMSGLHRRSLDQVFFTHCILSDDQAFHGRKEMDVVRIWHLCCCVWSIDVLPVLLGLC